MQFRSPQGMQARQSGLENKTRGNLSMEHRALAEGRRATVAAQ
jgi:hypothetical protein